MTTKRGERVSKNAHTMLGEVEAAIRDIEAANGRLVRALAEVRAAGVDEGEVDAVTGAAGEPIVLRRWQLVDLLSYAEQGSGRRSAATAARVPPGAWLFRRRAP
jgi:hypothetical protein